MELRLEKLLLIQLLEQAQQLDFILLQHQQICPTKTLGITLHLYLIKAEQWMVHLLDSFAFLDLQFNAPPPPRPLALLLLAKASGQQCATALLGHGCG